MVKTQSIDSPWGASVFGAASVNASPDLARLRVAIRQTHPKPSEAFAVTRGAVDRMREVLRTHGVPDTAVSTSRLGLKSSWKYSAGERTFVGYECSAHFVIELRDLDALDTVLIDVVEAGANQVDEVEFDVSTKKELEAQAREAAVAAARENAELYAEAAGVRLGPVIHIQDVDSESMEQTLSESQPPAGNLVPGEISVHAGVLLGFSLISD
jgi:uncharacterized protein YggE